MKISLSWLNDFVEVGSYKSQPQQLAEILTAAGLEVENIEDLSKQYKHIVLGHILEKSQHPDADKLSVCQVGTGEGIVHQIVCGAKNHKKGDRVVVALPGATLPNGLAIKAAKLRGIESNGMLCSEKELGLAKDSDGLMILPEDAPIGKSFSEYAGFHDVVFELKVTPNRADCLSHLGLARELACLLDKPLQYKVNRPQEASFSTQEQMGLEVKNTELCPRYSGSFIKGVKIGPSPRWLKSRLERVGMNSINNVVDVTNYIMLELGQPMHAFDAKKIAGQKIIVDSARANEKFVTLDGTELSLDGSELVIRDAEHPIALAGVIGGKNSGVDESTTDIFLESAYFLAATVRRTSRKFGIQTDSAYRFARGVNPDATLMALHRASQLILEVAGGELGAHEYDIYPRPVQHRAIELSLQTVEQRLGYAISAGVFQNWMQRLRCEVSTRSADNGNTTFMVQPPPFRWDLNLDVDLIEEVARLNGYEQIPETLPALVTEPLRHDPLYLREQQLNRLLRTQGFYQAINYGFYSSKNASEVLGNVKFMQDLGLRVAQSPVQVLNPLNEELDVMRTSLVPSLVENLLHNYRYGNTTGQLFEMGFAFEKGLDSYVQEQRLGLISWGQEVDLWQGQSPLPKVFQLKSSLQEGLQAIRAKNIKWEQIPSASCPEFLHPGQAAKLLIDGVVVGFIGTLHPKLSAKYKLRVGVALAELNLERIYAGVTDIEKVKRISKFPAVERDLAFVLEQSIPAGKVCEAIESVAGAALQSVKVFDVYQGDNLPKGQKSVAFKMLFQDLEGTLDEKALTEMQEKLINSISQKFSASVR